jgi:hypothetical protein
VGPNFVQLISGRYVGDLEGADANVREDVLFVLAQPEPHLVDSQRCLRGRANRRQLRAQPTARLTAANIPATIAALRRNEEPSINHLVAQALLGVTLSAPVSNSRSNARADIYALAGRAARQLEPDQPGVYGRSGAGQRRAGPGEQRRHRGHLPRAGALQGRLCWRHIAAQRPAQRHRAADARSRPPAATPP